MTIELRTLLRTETVAGIAEADGAVTAAERLTGGVVNDVWLVTWASGTRRVVKYAEAAPRDLYALEADGLAALSGTGGLPTPKVFHRSERLLLLQALRPLREPPPPALWEAAGRAIATLHSVQGSRHGADRDCYLGHLPQHNPWTDDGYEFFAAHRILRYLPEPRAESTLTAQDRAAIERICARLPEIVPPTPPVLTHGDLWRNNVVATDDGSRPVFIDPAVSWTWPDVDLSMFHSSAGPEVTEPFFGGYRELRPFTPDAAWRERMEVLHLRELLSTVAHEGDRWGVVDAIRRVTARFA